jgi:hypothetical protein
VSWSPWASGNARGRGTSMRCLDRQLRQAPNYSQPVDAAGVARFLRLGVRRLALAFWLLVRDHGQLSGGRGAVPAGPSVVVRLPAEMDKANAPMSVLTCSRPSSRVRRW